MTAPYLQKVHYAIDVYLEDLYNENSHFKCQVMSQMKDNGDIELVLGTRSHFKDYSSLICGVYSSLIKHFETKYPSKHNSPIIENGDIFITETSFPTQCLRPISAPKRGSFFLLYYHGGSRSENSDKRDTESSNGRPSSIYSGQRVKSKV